MIDVGSRYTESFFSKRHKLAWRTPYVCGAIKTVFNPNSVIDVGCADGANVEGFLGMGIDAHGIEGTDKCVPYLRAPRKAIYLADLRMPIRLDREWDVVLCLEVAEHIEEEHVEQFLWNLVDLSDMIVMSCSPPGWKGHFHLNCQEHIYWIEKMAKLGYIYRKELADRIKACWEPVRKKRPMRSYYHNLLCFEGA